MELKKAGIVQRVPNHENTGDMNIVQLQRLKSN